MSQIYFQQAQTRQILEGEIFFPKGKLISSRQIANKHDWSTIKIRREKSNCIKNPTPHPLF